MILEIVAREVDLSLTIISQLRKSYGDGADFGFSGLMYFLAMLL